MPRQAGPGHRIVAADQQGQGMLGDAGCDRRADGRGGLLDRETSNLHLAPIGDARAELIPAIEIVAPDPPQHRTQRRRRKVAPTRRHRSGCERRPDPADRGIGGGRLKQIGEVLGSGHGAGLASPIVWAKGWTPGK